MTKPVERELFGGAIKADYPKKFIDVSYVIDLSTEAWLLLT